VIHVPKPGPRNREQYKRKPRLFPYWRRKLSDPRSQEDILDVLLHNPGFPAAALGGVILWMIWEYRGDRLGFFKLMGGLLCGITSIATESFNTLHEVGVGIAQSSDGVAHYAETGDDSKMNPLEKIWVRSSEWVMAKNN
jgi:hypothetical protein